MDHRGLAHRFSSRDSASPNWFSFTSMRSSSDKYRLHNLRWSSPALLKSKTRPVSSVPPKPPARSNGTLDESCLLPDHMLLTNIKHELSSTVPSPSGIASSRVARYASWLT